MEWWAALLPGTKAAIITGSATIIAALLAAFVVMLQIGSQSRNAIKQNAYNEGLKLKLGIYQHILTVCEGAQNAESEYSTFIRMFENSISNYAEMQAIALSPSLPRARFPRLLTVGDEFSRKAIQMMMAVENYEIIDPRMKIFRIAISAVLHDQREAHTSYISKCMAMMPVDRPAPAEDTYPWTLPPANAREVLQSETDILLHKISKLGDVIFDFRVEMQNMLLGGLFPLNAVEVRIPIDPENIVIKLENHALLTTYFESNTP
jgi:hypothetical protein